MTTNLITPGLSFSEEAHKYTLNGTAVPGVTEIIKIAGLCDYSHSHQYYLDRGNAVHAAVQYLEEGDLDRSSIDPAIAGRVYAYERFMRECASTSLVSEIKLAHRTLRFAGTLDRVLWLHQGKMAVPDWKSGGSNPSYEIQLAAYRMLLEDNAEFIGIKPFELPTTFMIVRLMDDGKYSVEPQKMSPARARNLFLAALTTYNFRREFNLLPEAA